MPACTGSESSRPPGRANAEPLTAITFAFAGCTRNQATGTRIVVPGGRWRGSVTLLYSCSFCQGNPGFRYRADSSQTVSSGLTRYDQSLPAEKEGDANSTP